MLSIVSTMTEHQVLLYYLAAAATDLRNRKFQCRILTAGCQARQKVRRSEKSKLIKRRQTGGPRIGGGGGMWGRVSGGAAAPPLLSCGFQELATKTGFYQTAGGGTRNKRERRDKGSLMEEERGVSGPREAQRLRKVAK